MRRRSYAAVAMGIGAILCGLLWNAAVPAAPCTEERYEVYGLVVDPSQNPLAGVRVYVLLDRIDEKKFLQHGLRARTTYTGKDGRFRVSIDCAAAEEAGGPDPCARKPRHITVAGEQRGYQLRLEVHKLEKVTIVSSMGSCAVGLPQLQLKRGG